MRRGGIASRILTSTLDGGEWSASHPGRFIHPTSYPIRTRGIFPGGKVVGVWKWLLISNAKVKNAWSCTSISPHVFMSWCLCAWHELGIFVFTTASRQALGPTQPPIQWVPGVLTLGVKRPGREADHSLPSSAEVKNAWSCTSSPQYAFMECCLAEVRLHGVVLS
jgi:hypothetical protein